MKIFLPSLILTVLPAWLFGGAPAATVWDFDGAAEPAGPKLQMTGGAPAFTAIEEGQGLAPGTALQFADSPAIRIRPEMGFRCRFRLDSLRKSAESLASKEGEFLLRVDGHEAGHLSFFVQVEGNWEPRLRGPVIEPGKWYEVSARWTGIEMVMEVNGESFRRRHEGKTQPGNQPLRIGPITGVIDRLEIRNPGVDRSVLLLGLETAETAGRNQTRFGAESGWEGWLALGGAECTVRGGEAEVSFPTGSSLFVSPPLSVDLTHLPFACLEAEATGSGRTGSLEFTTSEGAGSVVFEPPGNDRPSLVSGVSSDQWIGTLRRLALRFSGGEGPVTLKRIELADRAVGTPWLYLTDLAAGRAKLRPGREESVIAAVKNLGGEAEKVTLRLRVPDGIEILNGRDFVIPWLGQNDFDLATWHIRAAKPGEFEVAVDAIAKGAPVRSEMLRLAFEPLPDLAATGYVPEPRPAKTDYLGLMHYCALWKEGTHYGWKLIEPWPGRRPAIGWYDEGEPEVADWHIKFALEHGVNAFIYCWYRANLEPVIEHHLGHAIHEGLFHARYRHQFQFAIMWENGCAEGVRDETDLLDNLLPYWIETYFSHPSYVKVDNQPLLFVWQPRRLMPQLGGPDGTRRAFDAMRARCRAAGFAGLRIIACMDAPEEELGRQIAAAGWDAVTGYGLRPAGVENTGIDADGIPFRDHAAVLPRYRETWEKRDACTGSLPDIPNVVMGWDTRPWGRARQGGYIAKPRAANFEAACRAAKALVDAKPAGRWDRGLVVFDNWTEFGEGHYLEPTSGLGFSFLNAIKRVFCTTWAPEAMTDIIPEDAGLEPPQKRYEAVRAGFGTRMPWQPRRFTGDLLAHWEFETLEDGRLADSSPNESVLTVKGLALEPGRGGQILRCGEGEATCPAPAPFFHTGGLTVTVWCRPERPRQSDRWLLNTVRKETTGYRLGLSDGRPVWQVPKTAWSHGLTGREPLPTTEWSHLAATYDNRVMRLYVDGAEAGSLERRGFVNAGGDLILGGFSEGLERARFAGGLDDVHIFRRVLSPVEIAALARKTK